MKIIKIYLIIVMGLFLISCEEVIDVDLDTAEPRLVVDAAIDWEKNTTGSQQKIRLSTTTAYYDNIFRAVNGADVTISNSENTIFNFEDNTGTGEYICHNFVPVIGETYTLTISLNGEIYKATETLISVPKIEENIIQTNTGGMAGDEVEITYYYHDNGAEENYYIYSNKNPHIAFTQYQVEDDNESQGGLTPIYYSNKDLKSGDVLNLKLYGISKRYYDYFRKILNASGNNEGPFGTTPAAVRGNINNQSNSANFPYGYFRLSEVAKKDYTVL